MTSNDPSPLGQPRRHEKKSATKRTTTKERHEETDAPSGRTVRKMVIRKTVEVEKSILETWDDESTPVATRLTTGSHGSVCAIVPHQFPPRAKLSLINVLRKDGEPAPEIAGDYILDRVYCDNRQARWEHTFPARNGLFRASLDAIVQQDGRLQITAQLSGVTAGPKWTTTVARWPRQLVLRRKPSEQLLAGYRFPSQVELTLLGGVLMEESVQRLPKMGFYGSEAAGCAAPGDEEVGSG